MLDKALKYRKMLPWPFLLLALLLSPYVERGVQLDNSLKIWFLESDPALQDYELFQERFGNDELVILMLEDKTGWRDSLKLSRLKALCHDLEGLPDVANVFGAGNADILDYNVVNATTKPLIPADFNAAVFERRLARMTFLRKQLFSADRKVTRVIIQLKTAEDFDDRRGSILANIKAHTTAHFDNHEQHWGGIGIIYDGLNRLSQQDFGMFLFGGYLIMFLLMWLLFRRIRLVLYALLTVTLATWFCLGLYGLFGYRLNLMTTLIPLIIILLGVLDVVHLIYAWQKLGDKADPEARLRATFLKTWRPCLFTTLTSMAGFLALLTTPMPILRVFGLFAALGIFFSLIFSWILALPFLMAKPKKREPVRWNRLDRSDWEARFSAKLLFKGVTILLLLASAIGISKITTSTYTYGYFPKDHEVVVDHEFMVEHWGDYLPLELMVEVKDSMALYNPALIEKLFELDEEVMALQGVGDFLGHHHVLESALEVEFGRSTPFALKRTVPVRRAYRWMQEHYPELFQSYIDESGNRIRLTVFGAMTNSSVLRDNVDSLEQSANRVLGDLASVKAAGYQPMYANIVDYVAQSQLYSLALAMVLILVLLFVFLKDLALAFTALLANVFPLLVMFGVMGLFGIALDTATASVAAIALSFCIDDTMHFAYDYKRRLMTGKGHQEARKATLQYIMPVIILTSLLLLTGYGLMSLGSLKTVRYFGILCVVTILAALYSQLVVFPWLLKWWYKDEQ